MPHNADLTDEKNCRKPETRNPTWCKEGGRRAEAVRAHAEWNIMCDRESNLLSRGELANERCAYFAYGLDPRELRFVGGY
jgi:hypothetical protein